MELDQSVVAIAGLLIVVYGSIGLLEIIESFLFSGLFLICVSVLIWLTRVRTPAEVEGSQHKAQVVYKSVSTENDPAYSKSTKIMLIVVAIVMLITIIMAVRNNL